MASNLFSSEPEVVRRQYANALNAILEFNKTIVEQLIFINYEHITNCFARYESKELIVSTTAKETFTLRFKKTTTNAEISEYLIYLHFLSNAHKLL